MCWGGALVRPPLVRHTYVLALVRARARPDAQAGNGSTRVCEARQQLPGPLETQAPARAERGVALCRDQRLGSALPRAAAVFARSPSSSAAQGCCANRSATFFGSTVSCCPGCRPSGAASARDPRRGGAGAAALRGGRGCGVGVSGATWRARSSAGEVCAATKQGADVLGKRLGAVVQCMRPSRALTCCAMATRGLLDLVHLRIEAHARETQQKHETSCYGALASAPTRSGAPSSVDMAFPGWTALKRSAFGLFGRLRTNVCCEQTARCAAMVDTCAACCGAAMRSACAFPGGSAETSGSSHVPVCTSPCSGMGNGYTHTILSC